MTDFSNINSPPPPGYEVQPMGIQPVVAQPAMSHQTTVVVNRIAPDPHYKQQRMWSSGICACFDDCESCLCSAFFGPCYMMAIASRMGENACMPCCVLNALTAMRVKLRTESGITGTIMDDNFVVCCCGPCALCQLKREMDYIEQIRP